MYHVYACYRVYHWSLLTQTHIISTSELYYCGIIKSYSQLDFLSCNYGY